MRQIMKRDARDLEQVRLIKYIRIHPILLHDFM